MTKPKRFLVFAYDTYYPAGGWCDLVDSFDTFDEAEQAAAASRLDTREIIDLDTGEQTYVDRYISL